MARVEGQKYLPIRGHLSLPLHERQIVLGDGELALVIHARSGHAKPCALARDRHHRMLTFDPLESLSRGPACALVQKNRSGP